jgi:hypothetical protein
MTDSNKVHYSTLSYHIAASVAVCKYGFGILYILQIRRPGFDSRHYQKKVVRLGRGPLSHVSTTEELLDRKVAAPVYKTENTAVGICHADHVAPSIRKSWQSLRRQAAVARLV